MVAVVSEIGLVQVINFSLLTVVNSALMCWIAYFFASNLSPALGIMLVLIASPIAMVNVKAHFNSPALMARYCNDYANDGLYLWIKVLTN